MLATLTHDFGKKVRFARSFLARRLIHVNLQLLYACNFRCRICDFWKDEFRDHRRLSLAEVEVISGKLRELGPQIISIGGGEPMLHPELLAIVRRLSAHHFPVMITNGSKVTPQLAKELFSAGMVEISVSVDYASALRHDAQRGVPGAYDQAIRALRVLHENRTRADQRVNMIAVIMEDNLEDVEALIRQCADLGITFLLTLYSHNRGTKKPRPVSGEVSRELQALKAKYRNFVALRGYLERFSEAVHAGGVGPCYAGRNLCNIDSQGNVTFCIDRLDQPVGNILTDRMATIAERLRQGQETNRCAACWTSCRGSIESVLFGRHRLANLWDYYQMTRPVPLGGRF